ncbi:MAG: hypothetical protein K940chlam7_02140 [Chlamydiae bacterium]|nr:hypothetical protein [Chlamydiota bacterium]
MIPILRSALPIARYLGIQTCRASSLVNAPEYLKTRRLGSVVFRRSLSKTLVHPFYSSLKIGREELLRFSQFTSLEKAEHLTCAAVSQHMGLGKPIAMSELQQSWETLVSDSSLNLSSLAKYNANDPYENFLEIFTRRVRPLLKERLLTEYSSADFIRTGTELVWSTQKPLIPLSFDGHPQNHTIPIPEKLQENPLIQFLFNATQEDAVGAWTLATPLIDEKTLIHEYGCWNGENLLGLLFFGFESGVHPGCCIGTDINIGALNVAETISEVFSLRAPMVQFHLSNALCSNTVDISQFKCQKQVKMALRLISILEPSDAADFLIQAKRNMTQDCSLIVSYALPQGNKYETNKRLASSPQNSVKEDSFEHGIIFRAPFDYPGLLSQLVELPDRTDQVVNCYYNTEGFEKLVHQCGYRIVNILTVGKHSDNYRVVVVLKAKR